MGVIQSYTGGGERADLSGQFNTQLTPAQEAEFRRWAARLPRDLQNTADYDLRGAWKADSHAAANGHLPDTWKKPNHPTFSKESIYSGQNGTGGQWSDAGNDKWVYWSSPDNLRYQSAGMLSNYFRQVEPDSTVILPFDYKLPKK